MHELKSQYTIVIVTHNMQQAARVSDRTAFFTTEVNETSDTRTGVLVEYEVTDKIFSNPSDERTEMLELYQVQSLEGPCQDCFRDGQAVVNTDLDHAAEPVGRRWRRQRRRQHVRRPSHHQRGQFLQQRAVGFVRSLMLRAHLFLV